MKKIVSVEITKSPTCGFIWNMNTRKLTLSPNSIRYEYTPREVSEDNKAADIKCDTVDQDYLRLYEDLVQQVGKMIKRRERGFAYDADWVTVAVTYDNGRKKERTYCDGSVFYDTTFDTFFPVIFRLFSEKKDPEILEPLNRELVRRYILPSWRANMFAGLSN